MRCLIANAAPVPYALKQEVIEKLGDGFLFEVYGSTEMGIITVLRPEDQLRKPGSCGKPYGGIEFRIVKDDGTVAAPGEQGELFMSTGLAMDGYHRTDEQLTEYEGGEVEVGRRHRVRRRRGLPLHLRPQEGHDHLGRREHLSRPRSRRCSTITRRCSTSRCSASRTTSGARASTASCRPRTGADLDLDDLARFAEANMAKYKLPRGWQVRDELPAHRRRQAPQARPARRVLARPRRVATGGAAPHPSG